MHSSYFRISITSKCNFKCDYCHKEGANSIGIRELSPDEIEFAVQTAKAFGYSKIKLTGGEPTLHKDILNIVNRLSKLEIKDLSIITNGSTLNDLAKPLWDEGLRRLNVSLNTINQDRFLQISKCGSVQVSAIITGIESAIKAGFKDTKLNFVYSSEQSDSDLLQLLDLTSQLDLTLVVLPVIDSENKYSLKGLYAKLSDYGIRSENEIVDAEGIHKQLLEMNSGAKVLLRREELMDIRPFTFCTECTTKHNCREGIFPIRLSASGELLPCMADNKHRIDIKNALLMRDELTINNAFLSISDMFRRN